MFEKKSKKGVFFKGIVISLFFHVFILTLGFFLDTKAEKQGGEGFLMQAILITEPQSNPLEIQEEKKEEIKKKALEKKPLEKTQEKAQKKVPEKKKEESKKKPEIKEKEVILKEKEKEERRLETNVLSASGEEKGLDAKDSSSFGKGRQKSLSQSQFSRYFISLRQFFQRRLVYPEAIKNEKISGKVIVRFEITQQKKITPSSIEIITSSGFQSLDNQVIKMIKEASNPPKPPLEKMTIELPIVFQRK